MQSVSVSGAVHVNVVPHFIVNPTTLDFGGMNPGESRERFFDIQASDGHHVSDLALSITANLPGTVALAGSVGGVAHSLNDIPQFDWLRVTVTATVDANAPAGDYSVVVSASGS